MEGSNSDSTVSCLCLGVWETVGKRPNSRIIFHQKCNARPPALLSSSTSLLSPAKKWKKAISVWRSPSGGCRRLGWSRHLHPASDVCVSWGYWLITTMELWGISLGCCRLILVSGCVKKNLRDFKIKFHYSFLNIKVSIWFMQRTWEGLCGRACVCVSRAESCSLFLVPKKKYF